KRIVVIPDTQIPLEDRKATAAVLGFIGEYQPDEVIHIGDLMDYPKPSRWSKGTAAEFQGSVFAESDYAKRHFLEPLIVVALDHPDGAFVHVAERLQEVPPTPRRCPSRRRSTSRTFSTSTGSASRSCRTSTSSPPAGSRPTVTGPGSGSTSSPAGPRSTRR